ncbi:hypothetical protein, partial [Diaphorobacter caeni]|uniref:hypothetical protein n=1 Tax=Diaphorobacter caeni TaxID=2784387 RepID=UPI00188F7FDE
CNRLREIAFEGAEPDGGPRYVLAQNASAGADKPLWLFFSVARDGAPRLVFSGSGVPVEFSEADATALVPLLEAFAGEVAFTPQQRRERRELRKAESEQAASQAVALGLLRYVDLHACGEPGAKAVKNSGNFGAEPFVVNHVTQDDARLVDAVQLPAFAAGLVVDGKCESKRLSNGVEGIDLVAHGPDSVN